MSETYKSSGNGRKELLEIAWVLFSGFGLLSSFSERLSMSEAVPDLSLAKRRVAVSIVIAVQVSLKAETTS